MREWELRGADILRTEARYRGIPTPLGTRGTILMFVAVVVAATILTGLWLVGWCLCLNAPDPE